MAVAMEAIPALAVGHHILNRSERVAADPPQEEREQHQPEPGREHRSGEHEAVQGRDSRSGCWR